jgi:hypothetical protein
VKALSAHPRPVAAAAAAIVATLGLVTTGCGGSPSSTKATSPVAFSRCVRAHGVPSFPDPDSSGAIPKETAQQLAVSDATYQAATQACQHLLPSGGNRRRTQADIQRWWRGMLSFARCMRSHSVSDWPDPTPYPQRPNEPTFELPASLRPTPHVVAKMRECQRLVPQNYVAGHIDNDSWQTVSRQMAGW